MINMFQRTFQAACALILVAGCASHPDVGHSKAGPMNLPSMTDTEQKIFASAGCAYILSDAASSATGQRKGVV